MYSSKCTCNNLFLRFGVQAHLMILLNGSLSDVVIKDACGERYQQCEFFRVYLCLNEYTCKECESRFEYSHISSMNWPKRS
jgi:hypothetical protein